MSKPITFDVDPQQNKWTLLTKLWKNSSVVFNQDEDGWRIRETIESTETFSLRRDYLTNRRYTDTDVFGLLGLSLLNLEDKSVYITEGVSDFFSAKLCLPTCNVLGVTQLGGSPNAKKILISLFNQVNILADNDPAGLGNAFRWKSFLLKHGVSKVTIWTASHGKDFTDEFLFNLKIDKAVQF